MKAAESNVSLEDYYMSINESFLPNGTVPEDSSLLYILICLPLVSLCAISVLVNIVILVSTFWIRRPISPTLHISLSLAGADMFNQLCWGLGLIINSLLPWGLHIAMDTSCLSLTLEAFRLGSIMTTMFHLLALAGNHYLGIRRPLHYPSIMTRRNISLCLFFLWIMPSFTFLVYFSLINEQGFSSNNCKKIDFLQEWKFRSAFGYVFFASLLVMILIYSHIYLLVRKHQATRMRYRRAGSTYARRHPAENGSSREPPEHQRQTRNEKAIRTTLMILGSVLLGWMPAVIFFYLFCNNCFFELDYWGPHQSILINTVLNSLIILKTGLNAYIYAARMHEIRAAIRRMHNECVLWLRCGRANQDRSDVSPHHLYSRSSSRRSRRTVVCRMQSEPAPAGGEGRPLQLASTNGPGSLLRRSASNKSFRRKPRDDNTSL